jgi:2-oxoglutarate dehydrogenase E1 component
MAHGEHPVDWGMGEHLAFATLLTNGYAIRITGQDSGRGTFSHRHAVLHDQNRERWDAGVYVPLEHVSDTQANFTVIDSVLSELSVLGFEYGYATAEPNVMTIWEAQFGDFANGAQIVIDQFITSGEAKWGRQCGLTLMLPHGYEGQGPEHSSARVERFLQLCADNNIQVVQPTNGAQIFHVLRRQMIRPFRKPLVIFTPKSLLRNKDATSDLDDFVNGRFLPVIGEQDASIDADGVKRVLVCSGKVYYDIVHARAAAGRGDVAILRVEQLYPFAHKAFQAELQKYKNARELVWVQDEPQNQGAWFYVQHHLYENMAEGQKLGYAGRPASASPAVGYLAKHQEQQKNLLEQALAPKFKGYMLAK